MREDDLSGRDVGLIGEKPEKVHSYENSGFKALESIMQDDYPATNIGTVECATRHGVGNYKAEKSAMHVATRGSSHEGHKHHKSGIVHTHHEKEGHPHHTRKMDVAEPASFKKGGHAMAKHHKFAAGGVGKIRKGVY